MKANLCAFSLMETLVASVIFLTVFMIATDVLGNLAAITSTIRDRSQWNARLNDAGWMQ